MKDDTKFKKGEVWKNPRAVLYANETAICGWLHKWGFSNKKLLNNMLGTTYCASLKTLEKKQIIATTETFRTENKFVFSLTRAGLAVAEARMDESFEYQELAKEKIVTQNYFHDLFVQTLTLIGMQKGIVRRFSTPRMSGLSGKEGEKIPDVIWIYRDERAVAVEVEVTQKYTEKLDSFFGRTIESIESGEIYECLIIMNSNSGLRNYKAALDRDEIPVSIKKGGQWRFDRNVAVRDQVRSRIHIIQLDESGMSKSIRNLTVPLTFESWMSNQPGYIPEGLD